MSSITIDAQGARFLEVDATSPFSATSVLRDTEGRVFFDLWNPPFTYTPQPGDKIHTVHAGETGRLDLIAYDYYGDVRLWWVIAHVNRILHPINEITPNVQLVIPEKTWVLQQLTGV